MVQHGVNPGWGGGVKERGSSSRDQSVELLGLLGDLPRVSQCLLMLFPRFCVGDVSCLESSVLFPKFVRKEKRIKSSVLCAASPPQVVRCQRRRPCHSLLASVSGGGGGENSLLGAKCQGVPQHRSFPSRGTTSKPWCADAMGKDRKRHRVTRGGGGGGGKLSEITVSGTMLCRRRPIIRAVLGGGKEQKEERGVDTGGVCRRVSVWVCFAKGSQSPDRHVGFPASHGGFRSHTARSNSKLQQQSSRLPCLL